MKKISPLCVWQDMRNLSFALAFLSAFAAVTFGLGDSAGRADPDNVRVWPLSERQPESPKPQPGPSLASRLRFSAPNCPGGFGPQAIFTPTALLQTVTRRVINIIDNGIKDPDPGQVYQLDLDSAFIGSELDSVLDQVENDLIQLG